MLVRDALRAAVRHARKAADVVCEARNANRMAKIDDILARIDAQAQSPRASRSATSRAPVPFIGARRLFADDTAPETASEAGEPLLPPDGDDAGASEGIFRVGDHGSLGDAAFVTVAYRRVLGREAEPESTHDLERRLALGTLSRGELTLALARSKEGLARNHPVAVPASTRLLSLARRVPLLRAVARRLTLLARATRALMHIEARLAEVEGRLSRRFSLTEARLLRSETQHERTRRELGAARARDEGLVSAIDDAFVALLRRITDAEADLDRTRAAMDDLDGRAAVLVSMGASLEEQARAVRRLIAQAASSGDLERAEKGPAVSALRAASADALYLAFENRFRGPREMIAERQGRYVPLVRSIEAVANGLPVLDVGCGRGEWLGLLRAAGVSCRGIDLNHAMVETARAAGHDAIVGDAIAHLESLPEATLGAVTAFHVVEHLDHERLLAFLDACAHALAPGGGVLFETPNPENLVVGACTFHLDPTHVQPLPPGLLAFLVEAYGFDDLRVVRGDADCDVERRPEEFAPTGIEDWFRVAPDYAVFARRPAAHTATIAPRPPADEA